MASAERDTAALRAWLVDSGGAVADGLSLRVSGGGEAHRWVEAGPGGVTSGVSLASVPKKCCLTALTATGCGGGELRALGEAALPLALVHERRLGSRSRFSAYLDTLPKREPLPFYAALALRQEAGDESSQEEEEENNNNNEESAASVEFSRYVGTDVEELAAVAAEICATDFEDAVLPWVKEHKKLVPEFKSSPPTLEEFADAASVVSSRAFSVDDKHGIGLVPLADLFNHASGGREHIRVDGSDDGAEDALRIVTVKGADAGAELFNSFGDLPQSMLLHRYGFVDPLDFDAGDEAVYVSDDQVEDVLGEKALERSQKLLGGERPYDVFASGPGRELLLLLRVAQSSASERKTWRKDHPGEAPARAALEGSTDEALLAAPNVRESYVSVLQARLAALPEGTAAEDEAEASTALSAGGCTPAAGGGVTGEAAALILRCRLKRTLEAALVLAVRGGGGGGGGNASSRKRKFPPGAGAPYGPTVMRLS